MISIHGNTASINLCKGDYLEINTIRGNIRYGNLCSDVKIGQVDDNPLLYLIPHRIDGPAILYSDGSYSWAIDGVWYSNFKDFQAAGNLTDMDMMILKLKYGEIG